MMQRVRKLAALFLLPLLLAGCTEQPPASTPPVDAETFLRELYGDRLVIEDGQYYYQWYAGEEFLNAEYDEDWLQPLQVDNQERAIRGMIEDGSVTLEITGLETCQPGELFSSQEYVATNLSVMILQDCPYYLCYEREYLDMQLGEDWYTPCVSMITAITTEFSPLPDVSERPIPFVHFDRPYDPKPLLDGVYRLTVCFSVWQMDEMQSFGTYAVATEFDVQNGEVVRD